MAIEVDKRKIDNTNTIYENVGKVINGDEKSHYEINNYFINNSKSYEMLTNKNNYNEFYKQYLNKFDELDNYMYHLVFPYVSDKKYVFTSKPLILGKKIVDWVFGINEFPNEELIEFYDMLKLELDLKDDSTISKRWKANHEYFSGNLEKASNEYSELFDYAIENNDFPTWYLDDICIDGRNILFQYENTINKFTFDNKYQKKINRNKHKLSYPDVDRIKAEIFDELSKTIFNNKNKSKYTIIYGIGLENCFNQIQQLIYLTIFYGSITHMRLIRELISNIMYMYAITFEDEEFYKITLRILFLSSEFKKFQNLYNKIKLKYDFVNSDEFINSLVEVRKSLFEFEQDKNNIFLYDIYGKYISDSLFDELTNNIYSIIDIRKKYQINTISDAFKALGNNTLRNNKKSQLLDILKLYFEKGYSRFYINFGRIINAINVEELTTNDFNKYQFIIDSLIKNRQHINYDLSNCIIKIKRRTPNIKKYDDLLNKEDSDENILYNIEIENDELKAIKSIVNIYRKRHDEREKNPNTFKEYWKSYNIGNDIFSVEKYRDKSREFMLKEYLPLASEIILSPNEVIYEKIRHIKLLAHLLMVEQDEEIRNDIYLTIHNALEITSPNRESNFWDINYKDKNDLVINVMMCDVILNKMKYDDILNGYIEIVINNSDNIEESLTCIEIINDYLKSKKKSVIDKIYVLFNICYKIEDIDIRNKAVVLCNTLIESDEYKDKVIAILNQRIKNITIEECKGYINLIKKQNSEKVIFDDIINELKNNRNFDIRYIGNKYL
mgnify:FL=1